MSTVKLSASWLKSHGWWTDDRGYWRCKRLCYGWPLKDALRLVREAMDGEVRARRLFAEDTAG